MPRMSKTQLARTLMFFMQPRETGTWPEQALSKRTQSSRYSDHLCRGQKNVALLLGTRFTSFLGASCFLPHSPLTLLVITNQNMQSQKDQWQCWKGTVRRLLYGKQHDRPQSFCGIEQRREQVSLQEVLQETVSQGHPVNMNGVVENHGILIVVLYMSSAWHIPIGEILWSNVEELHNCSNLGPINK